MGADRPAVVLGPERVACILDHGDPVLRRYRVELFELGQGELPKLRVVVVTAMSLLALLVGVCLASEVVVASLYWYYRHDGDAAFTLALTALTLPSVPRRTLS